MQRIMFIDATYTIEDLSQKIQLYLSKLPFPSSFALRLTYNEECSSCTNKKCKGCDISISDSKRLSDLFITKNHRIINSDLYLQTEQRSLVISNESYVLKVVFENNPKNQKEYFTSKLIHLPNEDNSYNLEYCIKQFQTSAKINGQWKCSNCQYKGLARKTMYVYSCSYYLIIQLKRFADDKWGSKNNILINYPINGLDMTPYIVEKGKTMIYDLIGVINHSGSFSGGHYYAYAQNTIDNKWREYNDSSVREIDVARVVTSAAYVLIYKNRNIENELNKENPFNKPFIK